VFEIERDSADPETGLPAEDIRIELVPLDMDASWRDMARLEREIRLERKEIVTLAEKCKREAVEYARKYPLIRIRNGWKPSPTPVLHQTLETEPPMHVACTFRRVRELADECKAQGVEGAEFQLVGWNLRGHDGRWPQAFPVEEAFGGEAELRKTAEHLKTLGYRISLHDNIMDAYEIAENFSPDDLTRTKSGGFDSWGDWSGGCSYNICPTNQVKNAHDRAPKMAALGVNGIHCLLGTLGSAVYNGGKCLGHQVNFAFCIPALSKGCAVIVEGAQIPLLIKSVMLGTLSKCRRCGTHPIGCVFIPPPLCDWQKGAKDKQ
jgi:hypothetical protein